jgi:hypothetical protein
MLLTSMGILLAMFLAGINRLHVFGVQFLVDKILKAACSPRSKSSWAGWVGSAHHFGFRKVVAFSFDHREPSRNKVRPQTGNRQLKQFILPESHADILLGRLDAGSVSHSFWQLRVPIGSPNFGTVVLFLCGALAATQFRSSDSMFAPAARSTHSTALSLSKNRMRHSKCLGRAGNPAVQRNSSISQSAFKTLSVSQKSLQYVP